MINRNVEKAQRFKVINTRSGAVVCELAEKAATPWSRFWGLMNKPSLPAGHGLWLEPCADIHSCFMRFEFDAVFISKSGEVLHTMQAMKPWRVSRFVKGGRAVLELPAGAIAASETRPGDCLHLEPVC